MTALTGVRIEPGPTATTPGPTGLIDGATASRIASTGVETASTDDSIGDRTAWATGTGESITGGTIAATIVPMTERITAARPEAAATLRVSRLPRR